MAESLRSIIEGMECTCHHCCQYLEANGTVPCDCSCVKCRLLAVLTEEKVDLVQKWRSQIGSDTYENSIDCQNSGDIYSAGCNDTLKSAADELTEWLAVNVPRIKAEARLEDFRGFEKELRTVNETTIPVRHLLNDVRRRITALEAHPKR